MNIISALHEDGYKGYIGAEHKPKSDTDGGLDWLKFFNEEFV